MRHLVTFLVTTPDDESTDTLQAFAEDVAHLYGPPYVGVIDYAVRVDIPECFVLDGSNAAKEAVDEILDLIEPDPWHMGCGHFDAMGDPNHDCSTWNILSDDEVAEIDASIDLTDPDYFESDEAQEEALLEAADGMRDDIGMGRWQHAEPGSPFDRGEPIYNREGYFNGR